MLSPTDAAWSVLEEGHRVEKIAPLAIPALMALYGGYQGAQNVKQNRITDPVVGMVDLAEGDDTLTSNALEFGTGLAQGFVPVKGLSALRGVAGRKLAGRRAAKLAAAEKEAAEAAARHRALTAQRQAHQRIMTPRTDFPSAAPRLQPKAGAEIPSSYVSPSQLGAERQAFNAANAKAARLQPKSVKEVTPETWGQYAKRKAAMTAGAGAGATAAYAPEIMVALGLAGSPQSNAAGSIGYAQGQQQQGQRQQQGGFQLAGQPSGGIGGVGNVNPGQTQRYDIFQGVNWNQQQSAQPIAQNWPQQQNSSTSTVRTGMPMSIGDHLIKSAMGLMDYNALAKAKCERCGKTGCVNKMGCMAKAECKKCGKNCMCDQKNKAEDGKKKPAHGMVIVIGSKAGPGPSTNGKRDDEKKE